VVELDEATLTDRLNQQLAGRWQVQTAAGPATVEQLTGRLQAGRLSIDGTARAGYLVQLPLSATTTVSVQDRSPRVQVEQATVGGMLVPEAGRLEIERTLQGALDQALAEEGVEVHSLEIEQGKLIARGQRV
jgi:hypothetical protein